MTGMESFQQSRLNILLHTCRNGDVHGKGNDETTPKKDRCDQGTSATSFTLARAMMKDIEPLRSLLSRMADTGEYEREGGVET
jgi:hypothetical protein